jgi:adenosine deaminase CECR1
VHREWLVLFDEVIGEVKASMKEQGREDEFIGAKVLELLSGSER